CHYTPALSTFGAFVATCRRLVYCTHRNACARRTGADHLQCVAREFDSQVRRSVAVDRQSLALAAVHPSGRRRGARAAVEFAGGADFLSGGGPPLLKPSLRIDGVARELGEQGLAWERAIIGC